MAITALSTVTRQVLYKHGHIGPDTYRTGAAGVFPGYAVITGGTGTKTCVVTADNAVTLGIAGLLPNHDIDTAYASGVSIPVYTVNSGAIVWGMFVQTDDAGADAVSGQPLIHDGTTTPGFIMPGEGGIDEYVGVAYRDLDVAAADETPGLVQLIQS